MSLQVWLPLTGDLHNQGLSNSVFINDGATVDNNGKIGKCYSFASGNSLSSTLSLSATGPWSAAAWIYPTTSSSGSHQYIVGLNRTSAANFLFTLCIYNNKISVRFAGTTYSADVTYTTNTWYHACFTYDGTQLKIYVNGVLNKTYTSTVAPVAATNLYIGKRGGNTGYYVGKLNDVRIYDHALSDKEVEEIAKGLVLHYKLDGSSIPNPNLFKLNYIDQDWNICHSANYYAYGLALTEALELNQDYTVQLWDVDVAHSAKTAAQLGLRLYLGGGNNQLIGWFGTDYFTNGHADYLYGTFKKSSWTNTSQAENLWIQIYNSPGSANGTRNMHIGAWKIEKGTVPTPQNAFNENIVYDSSGYGNNGLIFDPLTITTDTLKYNVATVFDGNTSAIKVPYTDIASTDDIFTLNLWFKKDELGSKNYETLFGGPSGFEMDTRAGAATSLTLYMASTRGSNFAQFNFGEWYMVTLVNDGTNELYYVNTELKKTIEKKPMPAGNYYIGAWQTEIKQNYKGFISDFRIYKTALTANQILELYNTSATIDNKGNVYAREVIE